MRGIGLINTVKEVIQKVDDFFYHGSPGELMDAQRNLIEAKGELIDALQGGQPDFQIRENAQPPVRDYPIINPGRPFD